MTTAQGEQVFEAHDINEVSASLQRLQTGDLPAFVIRAAGTEPDYDKNVIGGALIQEGYDIGVSIDDPLPTAALGLLHVLRGRATITLPTADVRLRAGDVLALPAQQLTNLADKVTYSRFNVSRSTFLPKVS